MRDIIKLIAGMAVIIAVLIWAEGHGMPAGIGEALGLVCGIGWGVFVARTSQISQEEE